jgi:hypothetical protein
MYEYRMHFFAVSVASRGITGLSGCATCFLFDSELVE